MEPIKKNPTPAEADQIVREQLGSQCLPVKLGGYWLVHYRNGSDRRLLAQSHSFPRALAEARAALEDAR